MPQILSPWSKFEINFGTEISRIQKSKEQPSSLSWSTLRRQYLLFCHEALWEDSTLVLYKAPWKWHPSVAWQKFTDGHFRAYPPFISLSVLFLPCLCALDSREPSLCLCSDSWGLLLVFILYIFHTNTELSTKSSL